MRFGQRKRCFGIHALSNPILFVVGLCCLLSCRAQAGEPLGALSALRSKLETYGPRLERGNHMWAPKDYVQLDELMRNTVLESFDATFDFAKTQTLLAELVHWQELPSTLSVGCEEPERRLSIPGLEDFTRSLPSGQARMPVILWKGVEIPGRGTLFAFQNSIWRDEGYYTRVRCNPYAVLVSDHVVWSGVVIRFAGYSQFSLNDGEFLVDAISVHGIPVITTVGRPGGHLGVLNGHCLALEDSEGKWEDVGSFVFEGGIRGWSYDSTSCELSLQFIPNAEELGFQGLSPLYKLPDPELLERSLQKKNSLSTPVQTDDDDLASLTASNSGQPEQEAQDVQPTGQSLEVTLKHYQDLSRAHRDAILASGYADVRPVSHALEEVVRVAFEVAGSFEGARKLLGETVVWCEPPTHFNSEIEGGPEYSPALADGNASLDESPRVFYASYPAQSDSEAVVLMNSLVTKEAGTDCFWLQTSPYALVRSGNAVRFSAFGNELYNSPSHDIVPLGVVMEGAITPTVLILNRYWTRARKIELEMMALNPSTNEWEGTKLEWTDVLNFTYDASFHKLTLRRLYVHEQDPDYDGVVNVVEQIEKWGPQRKWKAEAPISVSDSASRD